MSAAASRRTAFRQADLKRALGGARAAGLEPRRCRINPATGEIELEFGSEPAQPTTEFDAWKAKRDARQT